MGLSCYLVDPIMLSHGQYAPLDLPDLRHPQGPLCFGWGTYTDLVSTEDPMPWVRDGEGMGTQFTLVHAQGT